MVLCMIFALGVLSPAAYATATASDTACNDNGSNGSGGGSGFNTWVTVVNGGVYTTADASINGSGCGTAWGIIPAAPS